MKTRFWEFCGLEFVEVDGKKFVSVESYLSELRKLEAALELKIGENDHEKTTN